MGMVDQVSTLQTIFEASLVLLGFSGAVIALGDKPPREWTGVSRTRIWMLIGASITPLALSAGLLVLIHAEVNQRLTMQIASIIGATILLYFTVQILKRSLAIPSDDPDRVSTVMLFLFQATGYATAGLLIWNTFFAAAFWPILLLLVLAILHAARMFARLLFRPL